MRTRSKHTDAAEDTSDDDVPEELSLSASKQQAAQQRRTERRARQEQKRKRKQQSVSTKPVDNDAQDGDNLEEEDADDFLPDSVVELLPTAADGSGGRGVLQGKAQGADDAERDQRKPKKRRKTKKPAVVQKGAFEVRALNALGSAATSGDALDFKKRRLEKRWTRSREMLRDAKLGAPLGFSGSAIR